MKTFRRTFFSIVVSLGVFPCAHSFAEPPLEKLSASQINEIRQLLIEVDKVHRLSLDSVSSEQTYLLLIKVDQLEPNIPAGSPMLIHILASLRPQLILSLDYSLVEKLRQTQFKGRQTQNMVFDLINDALAMRLIQDELEEFEKTREFSIARAKAIELFRARGFTNELRALLFPHRKAIAKILLSKATHSNTTDDQWGAIIRSFGNSIGL